MSLVLDASMTIAWLFDDERTDAAHAVMLRVVAEGAIVPCLWRLEVGNVLRNAARRQRCDEAYVDLSLQRLGRLPVAVDEETNRHAWDATRALSRRYDLTLYDAAYLELALRENIALATLDAELAKAASAESVALIC